MKLQVLLSIMNEKNIKRSSKTNEYYEKLCGD